LSFLLLFIFQAEESKTVHTAAGKKLDGVDSLAAGNKKSFFEQKAKESAQVQVSHGPVLDESQLEAARKKKEL
jgi:hypothetical protein